MMKNSSSTVLRHVTFPFSYNNSDDNIPGHKSKVAAWAALSRFSGYENLIEELSGDGINDLDNIITLWSPVHTKFGCLRVWLDRDEVRSFSFTELTHRTRAKTSTYGMSDIPS